MTGPAAPGRCPPVCSRGLWGWHRAASGIMVLVPAQAGTMVGGSFALEACGPIFTQMALGTRPVSQRKTVEDSKYRGTCVPAAWQGYLIDVLVPGCGIKEDRGRTHPTPGPLTWCPEGCVLGPRTATCQQPQGGALTTVTAYCSSACAVKSQRACLHCALAMYGQPSVVF